MKIAILLLLPLTSCVSFAFQPSSYSIQHNKRYTISRSSSKLYSTIVDEIPSDATLDDDSTTTSSSSSSYYLGDPEEILQSRNKLLALALTLTNNTPTGKFINRPSDKIKLQNAINNLEGLVGSSSSINEKSLLGDWKLICTANLPTSDIRRRFDSSTSSDDSKKKKKKRSPFLAPFNKSNKSKLSPLQTSIQNSIQVTQRIRNDGTTGGSGISGEYNINRVDNVIEITPLNTLESVLPKTDSSPLQNLLSNININPLQVKKSKIVLVHRASIESVQPILRTKIALTSTILNVAGTSSFLEPNGSDILGINNLLGEWTLQQGTFDTPYVDEDVRISRSSGPIFETLRVFVKQGSTLLEDESQLFENLSAELRVEKSKSIDDRTSDTEKQVQKVVNAAEDVQKSVSTMASNAKSTIEKDLDTVTSAVSDSMDEVVSKVQDVVEEDLEVIFKAADDTLTAMQDQDTDEVVEALGNVTKAVAKGASDVREIVEQDVEELGDKVVKATDALVADVQDSVETDLEAVSKSIEGVRNAVGMESNDDSVEKEEEDYDETEGSKEE